MASVYTSDKKRWEVLCILSFRKNVYKWSVQYLEDQQIIELQHVWNIADYVMWIPLAAMDVFLRAFVCSINYGSIYLYYAW